MDYKDKIRKLLALAKSPEPEEAKFALRLRPEHTEAHVEPGQALLYGVRRAG